MSGFKYDIESDMFTCYFLYQLGDDSASIGGEKLRNCIFYYEKKIVLIKKQSEI